MTLNRFPMDEVEGQSVTFLLVIATETEKILSLNVTTQINFPIQKNVTECSLP